jgi:hypothetical protein
MKNSHIIIESNRNIGSIIILTKKSIYKKKIQKNGH